MKHTNLTEQVDRHAAALSLRYLRSKADKQRFNLI
jgi:hypothetical protein